MKIYIPLTPKLSICFMILLLMSCSFNKKSTPVENIAPPTAPATLPEVIKALSSNSAEARITAALALSNFGEEAVIAVPDLIQNLHYKSNSEVRRAAAIALGLLDLGAYEAAPDLIAVLQNHNEAIRVRISSAEALGEICVPLSVPTLALNLYDSDTELTIVSAKSIAKITNEKFPDADSSIYQMSPNGLPKIVLAARDWWEREGQFKKWEGNVCK